MKINSDLVQRMRRENAWSQEELAIAAGVNLRTVQRIETDGTASLQSKKALASAFSIDVNDLDYKEGPNNVEHEYKILEFRITWKTMGGLNTDFSKFEEQLNDLGEQGWDLFKMTDILGDGGYTYSMVATLKRAVG